LRAIKTKYEEELQIVVSKSTIERTIENFKYSFKRVNNLPVRSNDEQSLNARSCYGNLFMQLMSSVDDSKFYFIDEVGFNVSMRCRRGRSLIGTRAVQNVTSLRSRNISFCCAMNKNGVFKYSSQKRAYNTESFLGFIEDVIEKLNELKVKGVVIIMDNVPFHKAVVVNNKVNYGITKLYFFRHTLHF
jgi:hypothetical protein